MEPKLCGLNVGSMLCYQSLSHHYTHTKTLRDGGKFQTEVGTIYNKFDSWQDPGWWTEDWTYLLAILQPGDDGRRVACSRALQLQLLTLCHLGVLGELLDLGRGLHHHLHLVALRHPVEVFGLALVVGLVLLLNPGELQSSVVVNLVVVTLLGQFSWWQILPLIHVLWIRRQEVTLTDLLC